MTVFRQSPPVRRRRRAHHWPRCPKTGKQRFGERKDARIALETAHHQRARIALDGGESSWTVRRCYRCEHCGGWHLTSQRRRSRPGPPEV